MDFSQFVAPPDKKIALKDFDPDFTGKYKRRKDALSVLSDDLKQLFAYQDILYAYDKYSLLIILQAMDTAGKDGVIKHVMSGLNPQGCQVHSFKAPSDNELDHDYLWRCMKELPNRGHIGIFNRSYYEEVLVVKVHQQILNSQKLPPSLKGKNIWKQRYEDINNFEHYLTKNGIIILKFFLHISKEEQKERFLARIDTPEKNWKFSRADLNERSYWDKYIQTYQDAFNHTSTPWAPWHIIPANHKWFSRLAVANIILNTLKSLNLHYPKVSAEDKKYLEEAKKELLNE